MISYKRDGLERQSFSEVKMGIGSPICERVRKKNTLKTTFLNVRLQRLCKSHHLQCITSSKDSEKLEIYLCVRYKADYLCWMPMVFGPSDNAASLIGMILSLKLLNGPRNTSRNYCCEHNLSCHLQMPTKALSCKKEARHVNMVQKRLRVLLTKVNLKLTVSK